ncbi:ribosome silencing factor [Balneatrix alpica]|uniref:Ribosomal silencing factor RsfS n=1 Tax=Balneatrix alpica TaxID=75684 RepID=A0ABV5ZEW0_9GAMM|nr:ribosome silencing factor [Balneatrix alpica]
MEIQALLAQVNDLLADMKAKDVKVLDVQGLSTITDYMVVASGTSSRHVKAIADYLTEEVKKRGVQPMGVEGTDAAEWVLVDLGDVVVHVMQPQARNFYDLERLWGKPEGQAH